MLPAMSNLCVLHEVRAIAELDGLLDQIRVGTLRVSDKEIHFGTIEGNEVKRGGSGWLDSLGHSLSGAWRVADYAAVSRVVRLSEYT
jgi:hypothetical protein